MQFSVTWRRVASHKCDAARRAERRRNASMQRVSTQGDILMGRLVASSLRAGTCKRNPRRCTPGVGHDGARL